MDVDAICLAAPNRCMSVMIEYALTCEIDLAFFALGVLAALAVVGDDDDDDDDGFCF